MTKNHPSYYSAAMLLLGLAMAIGGCRPNPAEDSTTNTLPKNPQTVALPKQPNEIDPAWIAEQVLRKLSSTDRDFKTQGPVEIVLRYQGLRLAQKWVQEPAWREAIIRGIQEALREVAQEKRNKIDTIEVSLTHSYRQVDLGRRSPAITNIHRGVRGIELSMGEKMLRLSPLEMLARNESFRRAAERFREKEKISILEQGKISAQVFETEQFLVCQDSPPKIIKMFRGNRVVALQEVTQENVRGLAQRMGDWLERQLHEDGRMTYKYWPSRGQESMSNNMVRQFMATICLERLAKYRDDQALSARAKKNLRYNLDLFYRQEGQLGFIEYADKVKLGAAGLAARAIHESRHRDEFAEYEKSLARFIDHMVTKEGRFRTFYRPADRDDNQNFYPGEALYYWSALFTDTGNLQVLKKLMKSYEYYRPWHLKNRNPAFIPWHTQTYYEVWTKTHDDRLRQWIFEMNDWLLAIQQWESAIYPDTRGRFYDPQRPEFGVPHASSTGVYLEGLLDAFLLAREVKDHQRQEAYRLAICRGLRSVMQLELRDEIDMFSISQRDKVQGALRTTVYNNEIRVDNVQHNLMAMLKILVAFSAEDFRL